MTIVALKAYEQVILFDPKHADAHFNKGLVLSFLGCNEEAVRAFEGAIRLRIQRMPMLTTIRERRFVASGALQRQRKPLMR